MTAAAPQPTPAAKMPAEFGMPQYDPDWQTRQDERTVAILAAGLVGHYHVGDTWRCACGEDTRTREGWALHAAAAQLRTARQP